MVNFCPYLIDVYFLGTDRKCLLISYLFKNGTKKFAIKNWGVELGIEKCLGPFFCEKPLV
jgi:hypothetical protein